MTISSDRLRRAYEAPGVAARYAAERWTGSAHARRTDRREKEIVAELLDRCSPRGVALDVPCGAGRFLPILRQWAAVTAGGDASLAMLRQAAAEGAAWLFQADAARLPVADRSADVVLCMRLLHHLPESAARGALLAELARVSRRWLVVSFFDRASFQALRARLRRQARARVAIGRADLEREAAAAGWRLVAVRYVARGISEQALALLERASGPDAAPRGARR